MKRMQFNRRRFVTGAAGLLILASARTSFGYPANERLQLAVVGMAGYGAYHGFAGKPVFAEFLAVGSIATRFPGELLEFEPSSGRNINHSGAAAFIEYPYREGWTL